MDTVIQGLLETLVGNPFQRTEYLILADRLDEMEDPLGEFLRHAVLLHERGAIPRDYLTSLWTKIVDPMQEGHTALTERPEYARLFYRIGYPAPFSRGDRKHFRCEIYCGGVRMRQMDPPGVRMRQMDPPGRTGIVALADLPDVVRRGILAMLAHEIWQSSFMSLGKARRFGYAADEAYYMVWKCQGNDFTERYYSWWLMKNLRELAQGLYERGAMTGDKRWEKALAQLWWLISHGIPTPKQVCLDLWEQTIDRHLSGSNTFATLALRETVWNCVAALKKQ